MSWGRSILLVFPCWVTAYRNILRPRNKTVCLSSFRIRSVVRGIFFIFFLNFTFQIPIYINQDVLKLYNTQYHQTYTTGKLPFIYLSIPIFHVLAWHVSFCLFIFKPVFQKHKPLKLFQCQSIISHSFCILCPYNGCRAVKALKYYNWKTFHFKNFQFSDGKFVNFG